MSDDDQVYGRYALYGEIAAGGMATVHYGRLLGQVGFSRPVAIKRLLPELSTDPDFVKMFLEEARLAARVRHPNVVAALDVISLDEEILLVMDFVHGETLSRLVRVAKRLGENMPPRIAVGIMCGALEGLHAAHEAMSEKGNPLGLVHRDVSPQNIMVGKDGVTRVLDFGVAKATAKKTEIRGDLIKGKAAYMAPEQFGGGPVDRRADIFGASVCLWQALTGERLFKGESFEAIAQAVVTEPITPASGLAPNVTRALDEVLMKGLDRDAEHRWPTAREMAIQLERALAPASLREIGNWVEKIAGDKIEARARVVAQIERVSIASINVTSPESQREEQKIPELVKDASKRDPNTLQPSELAQALAQVPPQVLHQNLQGPPQVPPHMLRAQTPAGLPSLSNQAAPQHAPAPPPMMPQPPPSPHYTPQGPSDGTPVAIVAPPQEKRGGIALVLGLLALTIVIGGAIVAALLVIQRRSAVDVGTDQPAVSVIAPPSTAIPTTAVTAPPPPATTAATTTAATAPSAVPSQAPSAAPSAKSRRR